jgi:hypothetical protein
VKSIGIGVILEIFLVASNLVFKTLLFSPALIGNMIGGFFKNILKMLYVFTHRGFMAGLFVAVFAVFFYFTSTDPVYRVIGLPIAFFTTVGAGFVAVLIFRAITLFFLACIDVALVAAPASRVSLNAELEKARARVIRVLAEKNIEYSELDRYSLAGVERAVLFFLKNVFNRTFPLILFTKEPFVLIRLRQKRGGDTEVSFLGESEMSARDLAKQIETKLRMPA